MASGAKKIHEVLKSVDRKTTYDRHQTQENINERLGGMSITVISKADYNSLTDKFSTTIYLVNDNGTYTVYVGDVQISGSGGISIDKAILLDNYTTAPNAYGNSYIGQLPGEGAAYTYYHPEITPRPATTADSRIYDGHSYGRFLPLRSPNATSENRYIIVPNTAYSYPDGTCDDGNFTLTVELTRGGVDETLTYALRLVQYEYGYTMLGFGMLTQACAYVVDCTRTKNGATTSWTYDGGHTGYYGTNIGSVDLEYVGVCDGFFNIPSSVDHGTGSSRRDVTNWPCLTLAFRGSEVDDISTATPYLAMEASSQRVTDYDKMPYKVTEYKGFIKCFIEGPDVNQQLGLLYDPDTQQLYSEPPVLKNPPTGDFALMAKIIVKSASEVI